MEVYDYPGDDMTITTTAPDTTPVPVTDPTKLALAAMLTEPTGAHFLDSGGAYGRAWQRQQGKTAEDFQAEPEINLDVYGPDSGSVTLSVFHYLAARLEYLPIQTSALHRIGTTGAREDDPWLMTMEEICQDWHTRGQERQGWDDYWPFGSFNSYNSECALSQTIQGVTFTHPVHGRCVALQIHGGCDVRGGYTAPVVFRITSDEPHDLYNWNDHTVTCTAHWGQLRDQSDALPVLSGEDMRHPTHAWDHSHGDWVESGGMYVGDPWKSSAYPTYREAEGDRPAAMLCPECGADCEVYAPSTW